MYDALSNPLPTFFTRTTIRPLASKSVQFTVDVYVITLKFEKFWVASILVVVEGPTENSTLCGGHP